MKEPVSKEKYGLKAAIDVAEGLMLLKIKFTSTGMP